MLPALATALSKNERFCIALLLSLYFLAIHWSGVGDSLVVFEHKHKPFCLVFIVMSYKQLCAFVFISKIFNQNAIAISLLDNSSHGYITKLPVIWFIL